MSHCAEYAKTLDGSFEWEHFAFHVLRKTMTTRMAQRGVNEATLSRCCNHTWIENNVTRKHYNKYSYADEKREAWELWANEIERVRNLSF